MSSMVRLPVIRPIASLGASSCTSAAPGVHHVPHLVLDEARDVLHLLVEARVLRKRADHRQRRGHRRLVEIRLDLPLTAERLGVASTSRSRDVADDAVAAGAVVAGAVIAQLDRLDALEARRDVVDEVGWRRPRRP